MINKLFFYTLAIVAQILFSHTFGASNATLTQNQVEVSKQPGACYFTPPKDWVLIDPKALPKEVKSMVRGPYKDSLPPSMNLAMESTESSLEDYLNAIKLMHASNHLKKWKITGTISTDAGAMTLTQLDSTTNWGNVRMVQAIMIKDNIAYVITGTALSSEYAKYFPEFYKAIQSFHINLNVQVINPR